MTSESRDNDVTFAILELNNIKSITARAYFSTMFFLTFMPRMCMQSLKFVPILESICHSPFIRYHPKVSKNDHVLIVKFANICQAGVATNKLEKADSRQTEENIVPDDVNGETS